MQAKCKMRVDFHNVFIKSFSDLILQGAIHRTTVQKSVPSLSSIKQEIIILLLSFLSFLEFFVMQGRWIDLFPIVSIPYLCTAHCAVSAASFTRCKNMKIMKMNYKLHLLAKNMCHCVNISGIMA